MKFNPIRRRLYTDDLVFLKALDCPSTPRWETPVGSEAPRDRTCATCDRVVVDTAVRTDREIADLLASDPDTCLKVSLD